MDFEALNRATAEAFAEPVEWLDASGRTAKGIFDSRHFAAANEGGVAVSQLLTSLAVVDADAGTVAVGERVVVRGTTYVVKDRRPDGQGMTVLDLELAADGEG